MKNDEKHWQEVYDARTAFFTNNFGPLPQDILKVMHLSGVWPGGGLYELAIPRIGPDLWLYTTFGLTNPDMPATVTATNIQLVGCAERSEAHQSRQWTRTMRKGHAKDRPAPTTTHKAAPGPLALSAHSAPMRAHAKAWRAWHAM